MWEGERQIFRIPSPNLFDYCNISLSLAPSNYYSLYMSRAFTTLDICDSICGVFFFSSFFVLFGDSTLSSKTGTPRPFSCVNHSPAPSGIMSETSSFWPCHFRWANAKHSCTVIIREYGCLLSGAGDFSPLIPWPSDVVPHEY